MGLSSFTCWRTTALSRARSMKPWLSSRLTREKPLTRSKNRKREFLSEPKLSITIPSRVIIAFYYFLAELTGKLLIRMSSVYYQFDQTRFSYIGEYSMCKTPINSCKLRLKTLKFIEGLLLLFSISIMHGEKKWKNLKSLREQKNSSLLIQQFYIKKENSKKIEKYFIEIKKKEICICNFFGSNLYLKIYLLGTSGAGWPCLENFKIFF